MTRSLLFIFSRLRKPSLDRSGLDPRPPPEAIDPVCDDNRDLSVVSPKHGTVREAPARRGGIVRASPERTESWTPLECCSETPERTSPDVWSVFFSLRGDLPRSQWVLAMCVITALFCLIFSLAPAGRGECSPSWLLVSWSFGLLYVATLICAKRLLNCRRPVWLALPLPALGLLLISLLAGVGPPLPASILTLVAVYLAALTLPALLACAAYGADD